MTHNQKYQRRKAKRQEERRHKNKHYDNYDEVFSFDHLYQSARKCRLNVFWKTSVQAFENDIGKNVFNLYDQLHNREYKQGAFFEFDTIETGKQRHIRSLHIKDRAVQKCLCDYSLVPVLAPTFIYDNGASMKNKGIDFALGRMDKHLHDYFLQNGNEGYILQYDFSKYFESIPHDVLKGIISHYYEDKDLKALMFDMIDAFGESGLGLGSQMSQVLALAAASSIDHYFKDKKGVKYYGRYMDDGYIIARDKDYLFECKRELEELATSLGLKLNLKKTQITKLSHGFTFLKVRYVMQQDGHLHKHIARVSVTRMRKKLKVYKRLFDEGKVTQTIVDGALCSWLAYAARCDTYQTRQNMVNLYFELFGKETTNRVLQSYR